MEATLKQLNIDKSSWKPVKFGDIAKEPKENVKDLQAEGIEYVVGLEHIDSEDVHLRRSATLEESTTFTKKFAEGDVLFGRRRAYLKKAAQASFSGICSGDITVFRAKEEILPELLPFVVCNDKFFDYAVKHSAGGLSPRVKFKDLANYEFLLPPAAQQKQLAELLWAMDDVIEKEREVLERLGNSKSSLYKDSLFTECKTTDKYFGNVSSNYEVEKVGKYFKELQYGISEELTEMGEVPVLRMNNLQGGKLDLEDLKYYSPKKGELDKFILNYGDILFNRTNSFDLVGKVSRFSAKGKYSFASYLIRIKTDESELDSRFLNFYFNSAIGLAKIRKYRTPGVSQSNINAQNIKNVPIPLPPVKFQNELMDKIEKFEISEEIVETKIASSKALQKSLINQIF
ncbi:restriction endonuclease subunit S [Sunxiuqinia elliptica]|uniref:Type I restriction enzyme S subunit n=1 Tax=Sunxiuqinia elliptica TaxID=655355 RepID=A0A4R6HCC7_9BACT|nr:restriction endonuclease subunit S [Sunxiuqinia elliptica]TDO05431.1 type I restriction enzyme S subunit [Sunxiuqinia elliptica]TDO64977.1 type I restriction enzyme S subunit [Sunxiuqinia elliptica]